MHAIALKELAAHKVRVLATALAVVLGVASMAGTLIFTDTVRATYDAALAEADGGIDAYVRTPSPIRLGYGEPGPRLDADLLDVVRRVPGVDQAALRINGYAQVVGRDGKPVGDVSRSPAFGTNWIDVEKLNPYELADGRAPQADDEIVIDKASADAAGYRPGDTATVLTKAAPRSFTIVGIARFAGQDSPAGATAVLFTDTAAAELLGEPGQASGIAATATAGTSQADLAARVQAAVGSDVEVLTGDALVAEEQEDLRAGMALMATIFVVFAGVGVLVCASIIGNTFSITVAQRNRDLALLRAIGASGRQVRRSVILEALTTGVLASAAGLGGGMGVAAGLQALMGVFGFDMPDGDTVVRPGVLVGSFALGVVVTVLSAWLPARRASRIPPIAALRDVAVDRGGRSTGRAIAGLVLVAGGVAGVLAGAEDDLGLVGLGVFATLAGAALLGPVVARGASGLAGVPLRLRGVVGDLAADGAGRNPRRTARTATSLALGVALVAFLSVFASSVKASFAGSLDEDFAGTHIVDAGAWDASAGLSPALAEQLRRTPYVDVVTQARLTPAVVDGRTEDAFPAFDATTVARVFRLGHVQGDLQGLGAGGLAVSAEEAARRGWHLGTQVPVTFPGGSASLVVEAIYAGATDWVGSAFVDLAALEAAGGDQLDQRLYVAGDEAAITAVAAAYPSADVLDREAFLELVGEEVDTILGMFTALLAVAIVIALLGIANTLALSVYERTRELGLLRAVGMGRGQLRASVRWEAVVVAVLGAGVGLALGAFFGWAIVQALADEGIDTFRVPTPTLVGIAGAAAVAGAVAAVLPARRAARLDVLEALAAS